MENASKPPGQRHPLPGPVSLQFGTQAVTGVGRGRGNPHMGQALFPLLYLRFLAHKGSAGIYLLYLSIGLGLIVPNVH